MGTGSTHQPGSAGELMDEYTSAMMTSLNERMNLSRAHLRLQAFARVLICATFVEDAFRMLTNFKSQTATIVMVAQADLLPISPTEAWAVVVLSFLVQSLASAAVIFERRELVGCITLILWCVLHPVLYAQLSNMEFLSETVTVIGGLCILLSHLKEMRLARLNLLPAEPAQLPGAPASDRLCLVGRVLLCTYFAYYSASKLRTIIGGGMPVHNSLVEGVLVMLLIYVCVLVIIGSRSRRIAFGLAIVMTISNLVFHPFWYFWIVGHEYVSLKDVASVNTRLPVDLSMLGQADMPGSYLAVYDHERYFFFQRLSTVGALILLAVYGPGRHSMDEPNAPARIERFTGKGRD